MPRRKAAAAPAPPPSLESEKENVAEGASAPNPKSPPMRAAGKGLNASRNWEEELEALSQKLKKVTLEKEQANKELEEREAKIKEQQEELELKSKEKEKLENKLKKLEKVKPFQPVLSVPLPDNGSEESDEKKKKNVKRPASTYLLWCNEQRPKLRAENPNADFKETTAILSEMWKKVSAEEKRKYEVEYKKNKEEYLKQATKEKREAEGMQLLQDEESTKCAMEVYHQYLEYVKSSNGGGKAKKKEKDPEKPKQPPTAYFLFCNERRAALLGANHKLVEVSQILGQEWRNMDAEARAPYEKAASEQKRVYVEELETYKEKKAEEKKVVDEAVKEKAEMDRLLGLEKLKMKEKEEELKKVMKKNSQASRKAKAKPADRDADTAEAGKPKRAPTAFNLFRKDYKEKIQAQKPGETLSNISKLVTAKWAEMTGEQKQPYVEQAAAAKASQMDLKRIESSSEEATSSEQ